MKTKQFVAAGLIVALVAACSQNGGQDGGVNKQDIGTALGAVSGAWIGSNVGKGKGNIAAIAAGTLLGAYAGNQLGASLDKADMAYYDKTSQNALETAPVGRSTAWRNPDSGNSGSITPTRTYQTAQGSYCREFNQTIMVGGKKQEAFGTACRQPDGSWQLQN